MDPHFTQVYSFIHALFKHLFCVWHSPGLLSPWLLTSLPQLLHGWTGSRVWRTSTRWLPAGAGGLKTDEDPRWEAAEEEGHEQNAHFLNLVIHFARITATSAQRQMESFLSGTLETLNSLCKLDQVASYSWAESVPKDGIQRSEAIIKSMTFENQPTLYSAHHGQRQWYRLSIYPSNKALRLLIGVWKQKNKWDGGTDVGFTLFYFSFLRRKFEQDLMDLTCFLTTWMGELLFVAESPRSMTFRNFSWTQTLVEYISQTPL